nr:palmitoyl-monogalactosyldiacylglycerol delta-7 desaturase, chloroplastic [Ipomoea batatas]
MFKHHASSGGTPTASTFGYAQGTFNSHLVSSSPLVIPTNTNPESPLQHNPSPAITLENDDIASQSPELPLQQSSHSTQSSQEPADTPTTSPPLPQLTSTQPSPSHSSPSTTSTSDPTPEIQPASQPTVLDRPPRRKNPFTYRNGEIQHTVSTKLSPIVRAVVTPGSDNDGEDMPPPGSPARIWDAAGVALGLAVVTGALGVTLSYHRNLCHQSFKLPKWLEYLFAYCGVHALQGDPISWVRTHRQHHQHCDSEKDPHSPIQGFWYSHLGWLLDFNSTNERGEMPTNVRDLESQFFYKFIQRTYIIHPILLAAMLYVIGGSPYVVWGMGVRAVLVYQITFLVNSACHLWGTQAWNTGDLSRNNWLVALLAFGEGWHNNHHAFEFSAKHGLEWWQLDITWYIVWILQTLGLASDVKLPTEAQKRKMAFNNS